MPEALSSAPRRAAKSTSSPISIQAFPGSGFGVASTRDIAKGEELIVEVPLIRLTPRLGRPQAKWYGEQTKAQAVLRTLDRSAPKKTLGTWFDPQLDPAIFTNAFTLKCTSKCIHSYVFNRISRFNHSCDANAVLVWNADMERATVYALRVIPAGAEVTLNYGADGNVDERRQHLIACFGFHCICALCKREDRSESSVESTQSLSRARAQQKAKDLMMDASALHRLLAKHA